MVGWQASLDPVLQHLPRRPIEEGSTIVSTKRKQAPLLWTRRASLAISIMSQNLPQKLGLAPRPSDQGASSAEYLATFFRHPR